MAHCLAKIPSVTTSIQIRTLRLSNSSGLLPISSKYVVSSLSTCLVGRLLVRNFIVAFSGFKADHQ